MSAPKYQCGDIVKANVPHTDGSGDSSHPCLVIGDPLANSHGDYVLLQISSTKWSARTDYFLADSDPEFSQTGLSHSSTFRCHKVFAISESRVVKRFGSVGAQAMVEVESRAKAAMGF